MAEVAATLRYPRIRRRYRIAGEDVVGLLDLLERDAILVTGEAEVGGTVPEDPADEMVLACALDGLADLIVSGDSHLLDLGEYAGVPILTVRQFPDRLEADAAP